MTRFNPYADLLFARPSFLEGMARVLDLGGTLNEYNTALTEEQSDYLAEEADWRAVGDDLQEAIEAFASSQDKKR